MAILNNIFNSYIQPIDKKPKDRKLAVKKNVLDPALDIFTKTVTSAKKNEPMKRLTELDRQELIKDHSVLDQPVATNVVSNAGDHMISLLGQIHADALISGTSLQQLPSFEGAKAWRGSLSQVKEVKVPEALLRSLEQYEKTSELTCQAAGNAQSALQLAKQNAHAVFDLKVGESYLIEGGKRKGKIDCPILFEFTRTGANTFDLYVYLVGKEYVREVIDENGKKRWIKPTIYYKGIPADTHLFLSNRKDTLKTDFFQTLLEARCLSETKYDPHYVSLDQLGHLQPFRQDQVPSISERISNSDSWTSIKPLIIRHLGKEAYRKAILEIKLNSLVQGYQSAKTWIGDDSVKAEKLRLVLKRGVKLIETQLAAREVTKMASPDTFTLKARATVLDLSDRLATIEKEVAKKRLTKTQSFHLDKVQKNSLSKQYKDTLEAAKKAIKNPEKNEGSIESTRARLIILPESIKFAKEMRKFTAAYESEVRVDGIRSAEIEHLVGQMPIPNNGGAVYWENIPLKRIPSALTSLGTLSSIYAEAIAKKGAGITARESNTVHSLYAIIHYLAVKQDKTLFPEEADSSASLAHYPTYFPGIHADRDRYLVFTSPEEYKRRDELISYFKSTYDANKESLFNWDSGCYFSSESKNTGLAEYLLGLAHDERFADLISNDSPAWNAYIHPVAALLTPDKIKKGWLATLLARHLSLDEYGPNENVFSSHGFAHIPILAKAAHASYLFEHDRSWIDSGEHKMHVRANFRPEFTLGVPVSYSVEINAGRGYYYRDYNDSANLHPTLRQDQKELLKERWIGRDKEQETALQEAEVLQQVKNSKDSVIEEIALLRASCEPSLFPHKLISYFRGKLHLLESFQEQELFEISFLRSVALESSQVHWQTNELTPYKRIRFFPLGDEVQQKGFQEQLKLFIQEGLDRYFLRQPNQRPKVMPTTFFIRLSCRLSRFLEGIPLVDSLEYLDKMLQTHDLTQEEKSLLSLHLVLAYSTQQRELTQQEIERVFGAWVYYKNTPLPEEWRNPLLEREATTFIHHASTFLENSKDPVFHKSILKTALEQMGIELPDGYAVTAPQPHLIHSKGFGEFWETNLLTGEVRCADGILRRTKAPQGLQDNIFTYLFGNINPSYLESKGCYYFCHPKLGTLRAVKSGNYYQNSYLIQRQFEGEWYQYVPPSALKSLPQIYCASYTHWIHTGTYSSNLKICERESGKTVAEVDGAGNIKELENQGAVWSLPENNFLEQFERRDYIHRLEARGKKYVILPRYISQSHHVLMFEEEGDRLVFTENRKYFLSSNQLPGLLGANNGSLVLVHKETGAQKVIVPLRPLAKHSNLSSKHDIDVADIHVTNDPMGELFTVQKERFDFLEFDVKQGVLQPLSQEGTIYLAYQCLAQRRYEEAFQWLKTINFRERLSSKTQTYLSRLVEIPSTTDHSPEAASIALHAWLILAKAAKRAQIENRHFIGVPSSNALKATYSRFEHQIPENYLLNEEELAFCGLLGIADKQRTFYPELQKYLIHPERVLEEIAPVVLPYPDLGFVLTELAKKQYHSQHYVNENKRIVLETTYFIPEDPLPSNYDEAYVLTEAWSKEFEKRFFTRAYEIAKRGNDLEKQQLKLRMHAAVSPNSNKDMPTSWKFLQLALRHPAEMPELPDSKSIEARMKFVNDCAQIYAKHAKAVSHDTGTKAHDKHPTEKMQRPISAPILPSKKVKNVKHPLKLFDFSKEGVDRGFTRTLFEDHFVELAKKSPKGQEFPDHVDQTTLTAEEADFLNILNSEFNEFSGDCKQGSKINAERKFYHLKDTKQLQEKLEEEIKNLDEELTDLEVSILELANKHDRDDRKKTLYKEAKIEQELSLKHLADLFLQGDADRFAQANPYLRDPRLVEAFAKAHGVQANPNLVIDYLYNTLALYMTIHVAKTRLQRSVKLCKDIAPLSTDDLKRDALVQKLADELKPLDKPIYSIKDRPAFLVFEYLSGVTLRGNQAELLQKMLDDPCVAQLIMGGGKTSIVAVILMRIFAATKGRLPLFVTPASQYASVSYNLRKSLRECFGMDMEEIEVTREQLAKSEEMCSEILERLQSTIRAGNFLLIKAETLQTIGLEFLDLIYQASTSDIEDASLLKKINILREILLIFRTHGDALFDEVDLLLNVLQEVNFPIGDEESVSAERIEVIRALFVLFTSEKVALDDKTTVNLRDLIALKQNRQNLVSQEDWKTTVARAVAWNLSRTVASLKLSDRPNFTESFYRYINGTMSERCQKTLDDPGQVFSFSVEESADYDFLCYVKGLNQSQREEEKEASHQIALLKHMMQTVLPVTFGKNGKRHYGRGGIKPGEVRPYLAVDTASENLFGYHWEWISYHFQTALQCGISKEQLLHIAKVYKEQAEIQSDKDNIVFDATQEAIEFKDLTKVALHELDRPGKVEEALKNLNANVEALLRFEADTANEFVTYYPYRLTSTGQTLVNMLNRVWAMSGTPHNTPCYPDKLANNFVPAVGTEGQIADAVLGRAANKRADKTYAHVLKTETVAEMLKELLEKHPQKERVQILMDSGALFKDLPNIEVAKLIREITKKPVLFFMRNPRTGEKTPDTLAVLKLGTDHPVIIGGTRLEDIQKTGLNLEDYFVYADERHTTGTDIPLIPDAIGLMTLDEMMLRRTFFQTILRERDFFLNQDVEFVIPHYLKAIIEKSAGKKILNSDLELIFSHLLLSVKNQAVMKSKHFYRSCKQKIDELFKENAFQDLLPNLPLTFQDIRQTFPAYKDNIMVKQGDDLYGKFGSLEYPIDSMDALEAHCKRKLNQFPAQHPKRKTIEDQMQKILEAAKKSPYRPKNVLEAASQDLGIQVDVLTEVAEQVDLHVEQDVEQELLQELDYYQAMQPDRLRPEETWDADKITGFIRSLQAGQVPGQTELRTLPFLLGNKSVGYRRDFKPVFSKKIRVTDSWALTADKPLPVFHKLQRPLDQILIVKTKAGYEAIGLAQKEAREFKSFLKKAPEDLTKNVWLIQPDGSSLQDTSAGAVPLNDLEIQKILVEVNAFNGRIDFLDVHTDLATEWLHADSGAHVKIKKDFLKLRVARNPLQKKLFFRSEVFGDVKAQEAKRQFRWQLMAEKMKDYDEAKIQALTEKDKPLLKWLKPAQLNMLRPEQVDWLDPHQIPYLTKKELIQKIPQKYAKNMRTHQMDKLLPEQVAWFEDSVVFTQAMPTAFCEHMTDKQTKLLSPSQVMDLKDKTQIKRVAQQNPKLLAHISADQVKAGLIEEEHVPLLRKRETIEALPKEWQEKAPSILRSQKTQKIEASDASEAVESEANESDASSKLTHAQSAHGVSKPKKVQVKTADASTISATRIVLTILGILVSCCIMTAGAFAILGAYWIQAPQFMVIVYQAFQSPLFMPITFASVGSCLMVSLVGYAIHHCCKPKRKKLPIGTE